MYTHTTFLVICLPEAAFKKKGKNKLLLGRRGRTRDRKVAGLSMGTSLSSWFGMCMALGGALLMLMQS
jgi:hypothetical protein